MEKMLAAKEQIFICGSIVDEEIAYRFLQKKDQMLAKVKDSIERKRKILCDWFDSQTELEWVTPVAGVACFPRIKSNLEISVDRFYQILNSKYQTYVGPGHWFEMDRRHFRIGYGWPTEADLKTGLENITRALKECQSPKMHQSSPSDAPAGSTPPKH